MKTFEEFEPFLQFNQDVLAEILREGELRLTTQIATATAADQRALTIAGFQIASLTAIVGGVTAMVVSKNLNIFITFVAVFQIIAFLWAASQAIASARPQLFSFPGNKPENWFVSEWNFPNLSEDAATIKLAMVEQTYCLNQAICKNEQTMETSARAIKLSIDFMFWSVLCSSILIAGYAVSSQIFE